MKKMKRMAAVFFAVLMLATAVNTSGVSAYAKGPEQGQVERSIDEIDDMIKYIMGPVIHMLEEYYNEHGKLPWDKAVPVNPGKVEDKTF